MRTFILFLVILFVVFVVVKRQQLFLRDPLATVTRNDVVQDNMRVYINYSNDVLLEHVEAPVSLTIVQHGQHIGIPRVMRCIRWLACLTDAAQASLVQPMAGPVGAMSSKVVEFRDDSGQNVNVKLWTTRHVN